jgi:enoyl-CoA hydratase/carnithine racemase
MGVAKAKEVLFFGRKVDVNELVRCGFVKSVLVDSRIPDGQQS